MKQMRSKELTEQKAKSQQQVKKKTQTNHIQYRAYHDTVVSYAPGKVKIYGKGTLRNKLLITDICPGV